MALSNYIPDQNVWQLAGPPKWFLLKLWEFDASLVIVPSRQSCVYRLAQRRKPNLSTRIVNDTLFKESDTRMLASYNLVPVTSILPTANWSNPYLFVELANRAPWRHGGAEKVADMLDARDDADRARTQHGVDEHLTYLGRDAWKLYNKKIGTRSHLWSPTTKAVRSAQPLSRAGV